MRRICSIPDILDLNVRKIGFLAGSFDPPHDGHLHLMERVLLEGHVDHIVVCPHSHNPAKKHRLADMPHRLQMVDALTSHSVVRDSISTVDPWFLHGHQNAEFHDVVTQLTTSRLEVWIVAGQDAVPNNYFESHRSLPHVIVPRKGYSNRPSDVLSGPLVVTAPIEDNASSSVRTKLSDGVAHPIPAVDSYVKTKNLYE